MESKMGYRAPDLTVQGDWGPIPRNTGREAGGALRGCPEGVAVTLIQAASLKHSAVQMGKKMLIISGKNFAYATACKVGRGGPRQGSPSQKEQAEASTGTRGRINALDALGAELI